MLSRKLPLQDYGLSAMLTVRCSHRGRRPGQSKTLVLDRSSAAMHWPRRSCTGASCTLKRCPRMRGAAGRISGKRRIFRRARPVGAAKNPSLQSSRATPPSWAPAAGWLRSLGRERVEPSRGRSSAEFPRRALEFCGSDLCWWGRKSKVSCCGSEPRWTTAGPRWPSGWSSP
jgi:hypothetical protein